MNKLFLNAIVTVAALTVSAACLAQGAGPKGGPPRFGGQGGPGQRGGGPMQRLGKVNHEILAKLNLNGTQKRQVKVLDDHTTSKVKALMQKARAAKGDRSQFRGQFRDIQKGYTEGLKGILTPAQFKKYQALRKAAMDKFRAEHPNGFGGRPGGGRAGGK